MTPRFTTPPQTHRSSAIMNSQESLQMSFDWTPHQFDSIHQHSSTLVETSQSAQEAAGPSTLQQDQRTLTNVSHSYNDIGGHDASTFFDGPMLDSGTVEQPVAMATQADASYQPTSRSKYRTLDWVSYKDEIKKLYLEQDKTLKDTMAEMSNTYSFDASEKLYKLKFKEWGWQKKLPFDTALFMTQKSRQRTREESKKTIFTFGGKQWDSSRADSTVSRAKRPRLNEPLTVETPEGVSYKTPTSSALTPYNAPSDEEEIQVPEVEGDWDTSSQSTINDDTVLLSRDGLTGTDFLSMGKRALACNEQGKAYEAEKLFQRALQGLRRISGVTHEDTTKVAYSLANLYAETGRMKEAINVIEKVIQDHMETLGHQDRKTQQLVLQAIEVLNSWNRHAEAMGLLCRARELLQSSSSHHYHHQQNTCRLNHKGYEKGKTVQRSEENSRHEEVPFLTHSVADADASTIDYELRIISSRIAAKDEAVEGLLLAMIRHCVEHPEELAKQHLVARSELLKLYNKLGTAKDHEDAFDDANEVLTRDWEAYEWDEAKFECFEFMEAALQLVANMLKGGHTFEARQMFETISEKAIEVYGNDDERTVWILITIGIVYQTHLTWDDAEDWFERAFAAALANKSWGPKDGIVKSLQSALDRHHFSYLSNEGRPFKTIFGVSGIKIMPGRLHLE